MQTSMTGRPRPVTATVTKPKWMQLPNPDAMARIRSKSLESNGSTESLTSLLDHDSYVSDNETEDKTDDLDGTYSLKDNCAEKVSRKISTSKIKQSKQKDYWEPKIRSPSPTKSKSPNNRLSAWEQWVIQKAKEERQKKQMEKQKKQDEKSQKEKIEADKQMKLKKAEVVRQQWLELKNKQSCAQKKEEKQQKQIAKAQKEAVDADIKLKAEKKFAEWSNLKKKEEREKRLKVKEENQKIKQHEETRKQMAEQKFQEWLKQAHKRPKTAPNSFGYISGKMTGYHDRSAYPMPSFYNPIPWHPPSIPSTAKNTDKPRKPKTKPYKWNPEKYF